MSMLIGIQIVGILFALLMFYLTFLHQRRKEFTAKEFVFWIVAWLVFLYLVLFPRSLDFLIKDVLDIGRRLDFFIIIGFMFIIGLLFYSYSIMRKTQNKVELIVRKIAFKEAKKRK